MNFASPLVLMLVLNALRIFSEFSLEIKASLASCKAIRLSFRTWLVSEGVKAGGLSLNIEGSFGFWPNTNWNGENPWPLAKEFFAFNHHDKAITRSSCWSSRIMSSIFAIIMLFLSTNPFCWVSAAVTLTVMFMASHITKNWLLANSPPLSVKIFSGAP